MHPACKACAVGGIGVRVRRTADRLHLGYVLEGNLAALHLPAPERPGFRDGLWRHTCFEAFVARPGEAAYHEFNFAPSGGWAAYAFSDYRQAAPQATLSNLEPHVRLRRDAARLELDAELPLARIGAVQGALRLGLSAVVEADDGSLSYWALRHPTDTPDFHHRDAFVLELDEIRY
jgi:hypothetical protein